MLSGRARALPRHQSEENGNINLSTYFISSSADRTHNQSALQLHSCAPPPRLASNKNEDNNKYSAVHFVTDIPNTFKFNIIL